MFSFSCYRETYSRWHSCREKTAEKEQTETQVSMRSDKEVSMLHSPSICIEKEEAIERITSPTAIKRYTDCVMWLDGQETTFSQACR